MTTTPHPEPTTETLPDGAIRVCLAGNCGIVSSWHLVPGKVRRRDDGSTGAETPHHPLRVMSSDRKSTTLVGRASRLALEGVHASFLLTVKGRGKRPDLIVECQARGQRLLEQFELMDEGSLVGITGTLRPIEKQHAHSIVRLERLEILGEPLAAA